MSASPHRTSDPGAPSGLVRQLGLLGRAATGICSMLGAAINVIPFMLQRNVPGIGGHVLLAYGLAAIPAVLAAMAYASLASGMPRAGGSYVYASRALHPYLGFIASFSQWFGLSVAIGVVSYVLVPFLRDIALVVGWDQLGESLEGGALRTGVALAFLWLFVGINLLGVKSYARTLVPLMLLMFVGGAVVIYTGFTSDQAEFTAQVALREGVTIPPADDTPLDFGKLLAAAAILFTSFIGFDSIAQAGGEAKNPQRALPIAIGLAIVTVGSFYMLFTAAVYHTVPWNFIAERAMTQDLTAPGLLGYVLTPGWTVVIVAGAALALINDLPAMLLAVSRLMFAWGEDGVFPRAVARVHPGRRTPDTAILLSGAMASLSILGCALAGDFFLGVDILATAMLINFLLMCLSLVALPVRNPTLAAEIRFLPGRGSQLLVGLCGAVVLCGFLIVHVAKDLRSELGAWYFHSTWLWLMVMAAASALFFFQWSKLKRSGTDLKMLFSKLPPE